MASLLKQFARTKPVQTLAGNALAGYMRLVHTTARRVDIDTPQSRHALGEHLPAIFTFWHGEHFLIGLASPPAWNMHAMISRSADGTINAIAAEKMGIKTVRGAGDPKKRGKQKGGARAFLAFLDVLRQGGSVSLTADVPKIARQVSPGLIRLAKKSGRPIVPVCYVTHPHISMNSWDRASVGIPFSKGAIGASDPIYVNADDTRDEATLCELVKSRLDALDAQGYAAIGGKPSFGDSNTNGANAHGYPNG